MHGYYRITHWSNSDSPVTRLCCHAHRSFGWGACRRRANTRRTRGDKTRTEDVESETPTVLRRAAPVCCVLKILTSSVNTSRSVVSFYVTIQKCYTTADEVPTRAAEDWRKQTARRSSGPQKRELFCDSSVLTYRTEQITCAELVNFFLDYRESSCSETLWSNAGTELYRSRLE